MCFQNIIWSLWCTWQRSVVQSNKSLCPIEFWIGKFSCWYLSLICDTVTLVFASSSVVISGYQFSIRLNKRYHKTWLSRGCRQQIGVVKNLLVSFMGLRVGLNLLINQNNEKVACCFIGRTLSIYRVRLQRLI